MRQQLWCSMKGSTEEETEAVDIFLGWLVGIEGKKRSCYCYVCTTRSFPLFQTCCSFVFPIIIIWFSFTKHYFFSSILPFCLEICVQQEKVYAVFMYSSGIFTKTTGAAAVRILEDGGVCGDGVGFGGKMWFRKVGRFKPLRCDVFGLWNGKGSWWVSENENVLAYVITKKWMDIMRSVWM